MFIISKLPQKMSNRSPLNGTMFLQWFFAGSTVTFDLTNQIDTASRCLEHIPKAKNLERGLISRVVFGIEIREKHGRI